MSKRSLAAVGAVALSLLLAACGSSSSNTPSGSATGSSSAALGKVGVILPDTKSLGSLGEQRPSLAAEGVRRRGHPVRHPERAGLTSRPSATICDAMIAEGVKVLIIIDLDSDSGTACLNKANGRRHQDDRLRPSDARWRRGLLRVVRQRQGRQAPGRGPHQVPRRAGEDQGQHRLHQRCCHGQQRDPVQAGLRSALKAKIDSRDYKLVGDQPASGTRTSPDGLRAASTPRRTATSRAPSSPTTAWPAASLPAIDSSTVSSARSRSPVRTRRTRASTGCSSASSA